MPHVPADEPGARAAAARIVFTAGHSTRSLDELVALLKESGVVTLADVRRFPASRRHPHFNRGALEESLPRTGIRYVWLGETLGGRRRPTVPAAQSPNRGWQVEAFRSYADAMTTPSFLAGIDELESLARSAPTVFVCAERPWWQCHRRLIADFLLVRGWKVVHLLDPGKTAEHRLTEWARVENGRLTYPALL